MRVREERHEVRVNGHGRPGGENQNESEKRRNLPRAGCPNAFHVFPPCADEVAAHTPARQPVGSMAQIARKGKGGKGEEKCGSA